MGGCPVIFALFFETILVTFLCYFKWINGMFGTRMIAFPHFAVPAFSFFMLIIVYDELRRLLIRMGSGPNMQTGREEKHGWFAKNFYW